MNKAIEKFVFPSRFLRSYRFLCVSRKESNSPFVVPLRCNENVVDYIAWKIEIIL